MTGTSLDGLDAAMVEIEGTGLDMKAHFRGLISKPLAGLAQDLRHLAEGNAAPPIDYMRAARRLGELHAEAVEELIATHKPPQTDFIVAHGQTIWHAPRDAVGRLSWQLFDPWPIVRRSGVPVCYDLRQADLIAGGEGAPITPIADYILYDLGNNLREVVNLGGVCNVTATDEERCKERWGGNDLCPCNILIDGVVQRLYPDMQYDIHGRIAASGKVADGVFVEVSQFLDALRQARKDSLGREDVTTDWLDGLVTRHRQHTPGADIVVSVLDAVAQSIGVFLNRCEPPEEEIILAGGGARNPVLVDRIRHHSGADEYPLTFRLSDELGIPCEAREAICFAVLGALSQDGVPITQQSIDHVARPGRAGAWVYP